MIPSMKGNTLVKKSRRLWLKVLFKVPQGTSRETIKQTLIKSIQDGNYEVPENWNVVIQWRNKENVPMRSGEWRSELYKSRKSSTGFDLAVISYLENL